MSGNVPNVMVSSTYYDLREVRNQLEQFIQTDIGYRALISESAGFPTDPDLNTIENCRRRVQEDADILVLAIGNRYGSIDRASGKSVTNIEYSAARLKGIPIYAFVEKRTLYLFEQWKRASSVDRAAMGSNLGDVQLFEFIDRVRGTDGVWMHEFENATDLIDRLRVQLAYLVSESLLLRRRLTRNPNRAFYQSLGPRSLQLAIEQRPYWEHLLFGTALAEEIERHQDARLEFDCGLAHGPMTTVTALEIGNVIATKKAELIRAVEDAAHLVHTRLPMAFGPPGVPANPQQIVFVARQLSRLYREMIDWSARVRRIHTTDTFAAMLALTALLPRISIERIGEFGEYMVKSIEEAVTATRDEPGENSTLNLSLKFAIEEGLVEQINSLLEAGLRESGVT